MKFNPKARLDRSQVQVRRGGSGGRSGGFGRGLGSGSGGGLPIPAGLGGGGSVIAIIIVIAVMYFSGGLGGLTGGSGGGALAPTSDSQPVSSSELDECQTGEDANSNPDCARLAVINSIQDYWATELPRQAGREYVETDTVIFDGRVSTGCGAADSQVGPFYCPARGDMKVYLDTSFFKEMLEGQLGAQGGDFAEAYVLAHEYGHHIENLLGYMGRVRTQQGPNSDAVRLELLADCLAGMWTKGATSTGDDGGEPLILELDDSDIREAIDAAEAVGDDRIQQRGTGRVNKESWTHGSAAARQYWFNIGMTQGSLKACDTFETDKLYP